MGAPADSSVGQPARREWQTSCLYIYIPTRVYVVYILSRMRACTGKEKKETKKKKQLRSSFAPAAVLFSFESYT